MACRSSSVNLSRRAPAMGAGNRSHFFGEPNRDVKSRSGRLISNRSGKFGSTRQQGQAFEAFEAFEEMLLTSRQKFVAMAYAILRNKEDAEDAIQDASLSAFKHLRTFEGRSALTTWFTRIVLNAALMIQRKRKPSCIDPLPDTSTTDNTTWTEKIPASQPDPEMVCAVEETVRLIDGVLGEMRPALRQAFTMTCYDEMSYREACDSLGVPTSTFKARLFRARHYLSNHAQRSLVTPIRKRISSAFLSSVKNDSQRLATRADLSSLEVAFS